MAYSTSSLVAVFVKISLILIKPSTGDFFSTSLAAGLSALSPPT
jgi:hypothetical protein